MTVGSLVAGLVVFAVFIWLSRALRHWFNERVLARTPMDETTILGYLVIVLGFLVGLNVAVSPSRTSRGWPA